MIADGGTKAPQGVLTGGTEAPRYVPNVHHGTMTVSPGFSGMFCFRFLPFITSL